MLDLLGKLGGSASENGHRRVDREDRGWFASRFARLSTGLKMLLILRLGLFPIGLVAIPASVQSARDNNDKRAEQTLSQLEIEAQRLTALLSPTSGRNRAASPPTAPPAVDCGL